MKFHSLFDLDHGKRPTVKAVRPDEGAIYDIFVEFPMRAKEQTTPVNQAQHQTDGDYADPRSTLRTFVDAVQKCDTKAAKMCWAVTNDQESAGIDLVVGMSIAFRQLNQAAGKKFGEDGVRAIPREWRRDNESDPALELTRKRLDDAIVQFVGDTANVTMVWRSGDAVRYDFGISEIGFRKVNGKWKMSAMEGVEQMGQAVSVENSTWPRIFREQVVIMNQTIDKMEKGELKNAKELEAFIGEQIASMIKKYEEKKEN